MSGKWVIINWPDRWEQRTDNACRELLVGIIRSCRSVGLDPCIPQLEYNWFDDAKYPNHLFASEERARQADEEANSDSDGLLYHDSPMSSWGLTAGSMPAACLFIAVGPLGREQTLLLRVAENYWVPFVVYHPQPKVSKKTLADFNVVSSISQLRIVAAAYAAISPERPLIGEE